MAPVLIFDVIREIIDRAADHPRSLRNLALTCRDFLPPSRYHLLARYLRLENMTALFRFYVYLDENPHLRPVIRSVTLGFKPWPQDRAPRTEALFTMVPIPLLKLPNLQHWKIAYLKRNDYSLHFDPRQLLSLRSHSASITALTIDNMTFLDSIEFAQYLFAFPSLRSIRLSEVHCVRDVSETSLVQMKERLAEQIHLISLHMATVTASLVTLMAGIGQSTLEYLQLPLVPSGPDREAICTSAHGMSALRSIAIEMLDESWDTTEFIIDAWKLIKTLPQSTRSRSYTLVVNSLGDLSVILAQGDLADVCREMEEFFLRQQSHRIAFKGLKNKRRRETLWTTTLGRRFPELHQQGLLEIQCENTDDAYYMTGHDLEVRQLAVSPDSRWIVSSSEDATIILWDARRGNIVSEWVTPTEDAKCLAFSPDSRFLLSGNGYQSPIIWDVGARETRVATLEGHAGGVQAGAWLPNGTLLVLGDYGIIRMWDAQSFAPLQCLENEGKKYEQFTMCLFMCLSPDGRWIAFYVRSTDSYDIWDTVNSRLHNTLYTKGTDFPHATFDPTSTRIVTTVQDHMARIWNVEMEDSVILILRGHQDHLSDLTFSPSGDWVLSASTDRTVKLWDAHTGDMILSLKGHTNCVNAACFAPDEKYIASASLDGTVRLWRTSDGSCVRIFTEHAHYVGHVMFSPDGETLCSSASDGSVIIRRFRDIVSHGL